MVSPSSVLGANLPSGGSVDRRNWPIPVCLRDGGRGRLCGGRGWVGRRDADHRGRRGLPRSGLHLAYVAVGRGQGRVAAHPRGRAPRRDRVVSAAPARSDIADGEDISPLAAEFYRPVFTDELLGPVFIGVARVDLAVHLPVVRLLADGAAACRSVPPQGVAPSYRPHRQGTTRARPFHPVAGPVDHHR